MELITAKADLVLPAQNLTVRASLKPSSTKNRGAVAGMLRTTSQELMGVLNSFESRLERLRLWKVKFRRYAKVKYGQALFVCGDCESLGWDTPSKAVRMKHSGDNLWEAVVDHVPEGAKYRYLIQNHEGQDSSEVDWVTSYPLQLSSCMQDCNLEGGMLVQDNTMQTVRFIVFRKGVEAMRVVGSIPVLGSWETEKALWLNQTHGCCWERVVQVRSDQLGDFEYKLVSEPGHVVESGANRVSDAHLVEPQRELDAARGAGGRAGGEPGMRVGGAAVALPHLPPARPS
eukprot:CAMPEP_0113662102 /NCGR_PEP_ID=MMETSP0038_2-20120614/376_1 /TAXON_ID=2898 /ORGANISM="Cryptomonas paramecium" /LENGTH=286 /DNA_ID=CAMNT_0000576933 /DNA_START=303 /DNA_END=1159 /DNA_ORIENTATION=+ /assembly_acc=CAM_ASM_000170